MVQFVLYVAFGSETRYIRGQGDESTPVPHRLALRRIDPSPFSVVEFVHPFIYAVRWRVAIPAAAYAMTFLFCSVMTTVEIPQLFAEKFHFGPQQLGVQFIALIIGSLVGELLGTTSAAWWMARGVKASNGGRRPPPERRLWISYVGYALATCGIIVFLVMSLQLEVYNVSPVVGAGIAAAGNQFVTTVLINYAVDCYPSDAASVGVFITFVRQIWGFIGPFWYVFCIRCSFQGVNVANQVAGSRKCLKQLARAAPAWPRPCWSASACFPPLPCTCSAQSTRFEPKRTARRK